MARASLVFLLAFFGALRPIPQVPPQAQPAVQAAAARTASTKAETSVPSHQGPLGPGYVGDAACLGCHKAQSVHYPGTVHHLTSQPPSAKSILGPFGKGSNVLVIRPPSASGPGLSFQMEARPTGFYVTAISGKQRHSERIDVVVGAGTRAQTYLYWHENRLMELPVSYWVASRQWINSPGYPDGGASFTRPIAPHCLECHASYIQPLDGDPLTNRYAKGSLVTGIDCETCHGPGAEHIAHVKSGTAGPDGSKGQAILNPAYFSRDRQIDLCARCHNSAQLKVMAPAFTFVPGDALRNYYYQDLTNTAEHPDIHGNQIGLFERSRCYLNSPKMSCSTCHEVHAPEKPAASYSKYCLNCHRAQSCGLYKTMGPRIARNCIDCHMREEKVDAIVSITAGKKIQTSMRNHWIKVYPGPQPVSSVK
jgi:hypothetical protein